MADLATQGNNKPATIKEYFNQEAVKAKFGELLGKRNTQFITSVLQVVSNNDYLKKASPESVFQAAIVAAILDLPIQNNLGFAYIVPYGDKAQFQIGYKGLTQLAQRTGQFKTISAAPIYEGQIVSQNPLTGYEFDFSKKTSDKVVGYAAYFSLINGFEKTFYMTVEEITAHGKRYSKNFNGLWKTDFNAMATKTVLKLLLSKYAPLSVEMQKAVIADQSVINDADTMDVEYVDAGAEQDEQVTFEDLQLLYDMKKESLSETDKANAERILTNKEVKNYAKLQKDLASK